jgi:arylsulfatase A-like enzyme
MQLKSRLFLGGTAALAILAAYKFGGGAEANATPPSASVAPSVTTTNAMVGAGDADAVVMHLVDKAGEARLVMPNLERGTWALSTHWRKMPVAFHDLDGAARKITTSIALRTSETEVQWSVPMGSGEHWTPDARVWNMSEGSFDEREALFAPTPATIAFRMTVPASAKFVFSPATANQNGDATVFTVSITDARGNKTTPYEKRFLPEQSSNWVDDETVDLGAFAGQSIELALETRAESRAADEHNVHATHVYARGDAGPTPTSEAKGQTGLSLALWGNPEIRAKQTPKAGYNVLFIVVDALRPDVIAAFHDDAEDQKKLSAQSPPLDALLPKIPGLTPNLDALAARGVRFTHAWSAGSWTRPGTLAMLSGMRSTEIGLDPLPWVLPEPQSAAYYRSDPPMLPLLLRRDGVVTRAFVNNYFMVGYAPVGVDMGFERIDDHRYRTKDTGEITKDTVAWLKRNKDTRFFAFCNYNSPHEPLEPPQRFLDKVPDPPAGPRDPMVRMYMAEAGKDDEAIGVLMHTLDELGLREKTLVIVTADHGETLSENHGGRSNLDHMGIRFHHAVTNFEETTRIPILMSLPRVLPENKEVKARVRNIDIAPTILDIVGREKSPKVSGMSLMPLVRGQTEADERVVLSEGRATRGLLVGHWRTIFREGPAQTTCWGPKNDPTEKCVTVAEELFDLETDPGERHNVAKQHPDVMDEMRARLAAAKKNVAVAGTQASLSTTTTTTTTQQPVAARVEPKNAGPPRLLLRFAGAGAAHRVSGKITFAPGTTLAWDPVGIPRSSIVVNGPVLDVALTTAADGIIGLDVTPTPPNADVTWALFLDDAPWPQNAVFAGPFGLFDARVATGLGSQEARELAFSHTLPTIEPTRDLGMFVLREQQTAHEEDVGARASSGATKEMDRLLQEWGYAHGPKK